MKYRKLRVAWSVVCAIACVLLILLWVRSFRQRDHIVAFASSYVASVESFRGRIVFERLTLPAPLPTRWEYNIDPINPSEIETWDQQVSACTWVPKVDPTKTALAFPHWLFALLAGSFASISWLRWRFTLRFLLIATTLIAVLLGLAVWLLHR